MTIVRTTPCAGCSASISLDATNGRLIMLTILNGGPLQIELVDLIRLSKPERDEHLVCSQGCALKVVDKYLTGAAK